MKTTGVSCVPKFGLLVFLGHPIVPLFDRFPWGNHRFSEDRKRTGRHTCQRKSIQFSYMALFKVSNLKRELEDKMKEPFTDLIIQLSANDISNLQFLDDQDLKLKMAAKSTRNSVNVVKAAFLQNRNLRNMLMLPRSPARIQLY